MKNVLSLRLFVLATILGTVSVPFFYSPFVSAQTVVTQQTAEGIAGDVDKKRRSPQISYTVQINGETTNILVDYTLPNNEYEKYPVQFDFYVNRKLFATQMASTSLPGPIGIDIGTDIATIPFNYSIVATLRHPNRNFTTVAHGAVEEAPDPIILTCDLEREIETGNDVVVQSGRDQQVQLVLGSNGDSVSGTLSGVLDAQADDSADDETNEPDESTDSDADTDTDAANEDGSEDTPEEDNTDNESESVTPEPFSAGFQITVDGNEARGSISVTTPSPSQQYSVSGTVERDSEGKISGLSLEDEEVFISLDCGNGTENEVASFVARITE